MHFCWKPLNPFRRILMISDPAGSKQNRISINQSKISRGASIIHEGRSWLTLIQPQIFFFSTTLGLPAASWIHFKAAVRQKSKIERKEKKSKAFSYQRPKVGSNGTKQIEQEIFFFSNFYQSIMMKLKVEEKIIIIKFRLKTRSRIKKLFPCLRKRESWRYFAGSEYFVNIQTSFTASSPISKSNGSTIKLMARVFRLHRTLARHTGLASQGEQRPKPLAM